MILFHNPAAKKLLAALALFGLAAFVFGQDAPKPAPALVLSGYLDTGVTVLANGTDKAVIGLWGDDASANGGRLKLMGKYDNGDAGLSFETRWDGLVNVSDFTKLTAPAVYLKHAYAYAQFFDKMIYTQAGIVKEESTKTGGDKNFKFATETAGAVVVAKPIDGLVIQAFIQPANLLKDKKNNVGTVVAANNNDGIGNFSDTASALSVAYTLKDVARVSAGAQFYGSTYNGYALSKAYAGANLYLVPNLAATVEGQMESLNTGTKSGMTTVVETLSYGFKDLGWPALTAGLVTYQYLYDTDVKTNSSKDQQALSLRIQPSVTYVVSDLVTTGVKAAYISGAAATALGTNGYSYDLGPTYGVPVVTAKNNLNKVATFELKPSVKFTLTKTQALTLQYAYTLSIGSDDVLFLTTNKDAKSMQTIQANYTYSF